MTERLRAAAKSVPTKATAKTTKKKAASKKKTVTTKKTVAAKSTKKAATKKATTKKAAAKKTVAKKVTTKKTTTTAGTKKKSATSKVAAKTTAAKTATSVTRRAAASPPPSATPAATAADPQSEAAAETTARKTTVKKKTTAAAASPKGRLTSSTRRPAPDRAAAGRAKEASVTELKSRGKPLPRRAIRCYLCGHCFEVSEKTMSTTCAKCHKAIKVEDVQVKSYLPVNDLQTCGHIRITKRGRVAARNIQSGKGISCEGSLEGSIETDGNVELGPKASWKGTVLHSRTLKISDGASLHGRVQVPWKREE
ncbi:MAG: polymer-forming cytoskeletal protein [Phycisphaerales bacterium]|nr:polymer-forming cytoskeletal protein [Phycisphaerales bacterium]